MSTWQDRQKTAIEALKKALKQRGRNKETLKKWLLDAAERGCAESVGLLIDAGADVNVRSASGATPLHLAATFGHAKVVQQLVNAGADVNAQQERGATALMYVAHNGYTEIAEILLAARSDIALTNKSGHDAAHYCADRLHPDLLRRLLDAGCPPPDLDVIWHGIDAADGRDIYRDDIAQRAAECFIILTDSYGWSAEKTINEISDYDTPAARIARSLMEARILAGVTIKAAAAAPGPFAI